MEHDERCEALALRAALQKRLNFQEEELRELYTKGFLCWCPERKITEGFQPSFKQTQVRVAHGLDYIMEKRQKPQANLKPGENGEVTVTSSGSRVEDEEVKNVIEVDFRMRRRLDRG